MTHQRNETPEPLAQGEAGEMKRKFPTRILALLEFVADRHPPEGLAPYEDEHGEPMQDDADAALAWISTNTAALQAKDAEIARLKAVLVDVDGYLCDEPAVWKVMNLLSRARAAMKGEAA